jgi:hypothetical protein
MRASRTYGSVRGAPSNGRLYRDWSGRSPKRQASPALGNSMVPVERTVYDGGLDFQE